MIKAKLDDASEADKPALKSDEQGIKILANATSYGIFVELNVEDYVTAKPMIGHGGRSESLRFKSKEFEKLGAYFHPLLATLITGAARLMLANVRTPSGLGRLAITFADRFGRRDHLHQHGPHFTLGRDARI